MPKGVVRAYPVKTHLLGSPSLSPPAKSITLPQLLKRIEACNECDDALPMGPRPLVQAGAQAAVVIIGQAPGIRAHESRVPWDDASGQRLRQWLGLTDEQFYDPRLVALMPMGFCYPGTGKSGDLPPRPECAATWRAPLLRALGVNEMISLVSEVRRCFPLPEQTRTSAVSGLRAAH